MSLLKRIFGVEKPIIGMIHLRPLPGSPKSRGFKEVLEAALRDARNLVEGGVDGLLVENFMDVPFYPDKVPPHIVSYMTIVVWELKKKFDTPIGVNVLRNDALSAIAISSAANADFIRVNVHMGCAATDQGIIQGKAYETLRYRLLLNSDVKIFADVTVKHGRRIYDAPLSRFAREVFYRGGADALIVTGSETGGEASVEDIKTVREAVPEAPLLVGSGVRPENVGRMLSHADGAIVGTYFKIDGVVWNPVDPSRVRRLMKMVEKLR